MPYLNLQTDSLSTNADARQHATLLRSLGFALCKPDPAEKKPTYPRWGTKSKEADDFAAGDMIGVIAGPLSDGCRNQHALVIVDLDAPDAVTRADEFLPTTAMEEGRASKPRSHRYFLIPVATIPEWAQSHAEQAAQAAIDETGHPGPFKKSFHHADSDKTVIDFIGTGGQCVCPPSVHSSGEHREWTGGAPGKPATIEFGDLWLAVCRLATSCACKPPSACKWPWSALSDELAEHLKQFDEHFSPSTNGKWTQRASGSDAVKRARAYIAKIPGAISGQHGHDSAFHTAMELVEGFGLEEADSLALLAEWNATCKPPWSDKELAHKISEAVKKADPSKRGHRLRDVSRNGTAGNTANPSVDQIECRTRPMPVAYKPFPVELLPQPIRNYVQQAAAAIGCDPAMVALPALATAASLIGNKRSIRLKSGWFEPCIIWTGIVGESGSHKSPALSAAVEPLQAMQREMVADWQIKMEAYRSELQTWKDTPKSERGEEPRAPILSRVVMADSTIEAAAKIVSENSAGVLLSKDELAGWIGSFSRYKSAAGGSDLQHWLEAHGGRAWIIDRKTGEPKTVFIPHVAISVCGGIQPAVLAKQLTGEHWASGFSARMLLAMPDRRAKVWTENEIDLETQYAYSNLLAALRALTFKIDGPNELPHAIRMTAAAKEEWVRFYDQWGRKQADSSGNLAAAFSKLEGYAARLALVHHVVTRVGSGLADTVEMESDSIRPGIGLAHWFADEAERIYTILAEDESQTETRRLVEMIRNRGGSITSRELQRSNSRKCLNSEAAEAVLDDLVRQGYGEWKPASTGERGGRRTKSFFLCMTDDNTDTTHGSDTADEKGAHDTTSDTTSDYPGSPEENGVVSVVSCVGQGKRVNSEAFVHSHPENDGSEVVSCASEIDFDLV